MFHLLKFHLIFQNPPVLPVPSSAIQCGANPSDFKSSVRHRQRGGAGTEPLVITAEDKGGGLPGTYITLGTLN